MVFDFVKDFDVTSFERVVFFPCSSRIEEVLYVYPEIKNKDLLIIDNDKSKKGQHIRCLDLLITIEDYSYLDNALSCPNTAIVICSHKKELLKQLSSTDKTTRLNVYVCNFENTHLLSEYRIKLRDRYLVYKFNKSLLRIVCDRQNKDESFYDKKYLKYLDDSKLYFPCVQLVVTTACTLNCKECFAAKPYLEQHKINSYEEIKGDVDAFLECIDGCVELELIGGEFFLWRNCEKIIRYLRNNPKIEMLLITSNGTIIPRKGILDSMRHEKVVVAISEYEKANYKETEAVLSQNGINWHSIQENWYPMPQYNDNTKSFSSYRFSDEKLREAYYKCPNSKTCFAIVNHRLYICYRSAMLDLLQGHSFDRYEYADLSLPFEERREQIKTILNSGFTAGCNYCGMSGNIENKEMIPPGIQI